MATQSRDIVIEQGQLITKGATVIVAVDLYERSGQDFQVANASATLYSAAGVAVSSEITAVVSSSMRTGGARVQVSVAGATTAALSARADYYLVWSITLGDGQTRLARQSVEIRAV